ncbi:hypothetical protein PNEG_04305 [Pneumocystis murina B123]|uniref:Rab-GAP TBC domain-containing protein n=1 Tax=Pneumocystis murina (strain B123) TaxID=1069680 RepID=A0A0W4ZWY5_PNEMU|nr:hypothetical protein PNEG_04305 [Pneumocystis murina B123]KTW32886.1 hypothetical protein PNEG_04305 [Pneumocystis murina B123]
MSKNEKIENEMNYAKKEKELLEIREETGLNRFMYIKSYISNGNVGEEKKNCSSTEEVLQEIGNGYQKIKDKKEMGDSLKKKESQQNEIKSNIDLEKKKQSEENNSILSSDLDEYLPKKTICEESKESSVEEKGSNIQKNRFKWLRSTSSGTLISSLTRSPFSGNIGFSIIPSHIRNSSQTSSSIQEIIQQPISAEKISKTSTEKLQEDFERIYKQVSGDETIDWDFFRLMINDYSFVAEKHKEELSSVISSGIPPVLRGVLWQTMASSKNTDMEYIYHTLINQTAPNEKIIRRDLHRTFPKPILKAMELYKILKAYSLYDPEVGYTQGMAFLAGPLLLYMSDEEAFCMFVKLMKDYDFRSFYIAGMPGLNLRLYQFERLLEDKLLAIYLHLRSQGVRPSMYASQWFLTLFAYKFPINMVTRIFDVVIAEGIDSILKFAIALMKKNQEEIISLKFDQLLNFLKEKIFFVYSTPEKSTAKLSWLTHAADYRVDEFVNDAYSIEITENLLSKYAAEYKEIKELEIEKDNEINILKSENSSLSLKVKDLQDSLNTLSEENIQLANTMIQNKIQIASLIDENEGLISKVSELKLTVESQPAEIEKRMQSEIQKVVDKNLQVIDKNRILEDQMAEIEAELAQTKIQLATINNEHDALKKKWNELKKALEN